MWFTSWTAMLKAFVLKAVCSRSVYGRGSGQAGGVGGLLHKLGWYLNFCVDACGGLTLPALTFDILGIHTYTCIYIHIYIDIHRYT